MAFEWFGPFSLVVLWVLVTVHMSGLALCQCFYVSFKIGGRTSRQYPQFLSLLTVVQSPVANGLDLIHIDILT